ncbi:RHTO0S11e06370g1_1 [Rhodotorula toruloides]|uniref:Phosphatidylserine decarboxylase proenzyme 2 n=1 Tax=Rhodotorula toruloides TaxID=5286 RepID=A0A061BDH0_RHOTO|nr:RHTO0S11e06370g1_1 [Rhodotorula toruloides]
MSKAPGTRDSLRAQPPLAAGDTDATSPPSPAPSPGLRRALLSKLPVRHLARIPRVAAAGPRRLKQLGSRSQRRDALFRPLEEGAEPLGTFVVRVHAGRDLVAKDKNGLSDPYLVMRFGPHRVTSPIVPKTLNPVWGAGGETGSLEGVGGEAKLELKLFDCLALGYERIEIVCYDKDRLGSEYMGELSLGLEDWWGRDAKKWKDEKPPVGFHDNENEPIWHTLRSSRSRSSVSGQLLVQIGFLPAATTSSRKLSDQDRERILGALGRVASELEGARRASREERVFLVPPTDGLGTQPADEASPLGTVIDDPDSESSDSDADTASISTDGDESDTEDASSTGDEDVPSSREQGYFDLPTDAQLEKSTSPEHAVTESPPPIPDIRVEEQAHASSSSSSSANIPIPPPTPSRRGLSLPGFVKRRFSSQNILSTASQPTTPAAESDVASTTDIDSAATASSSIAAETKKRRRFPRRRKSADLDAGIADGLVEMSLVAGSVGLSPAATPGKRKGRRRSKKGEDGATDGKRRRSRRSRKTHHGAFTLAPNDGIAGLVQIEITGAKDLPRFKNAFRTSYDMDPFVVIAFGHKIFRTRVIRHSLNPVWEERLYFHVGEAETHWTIGFTVSDWDKISGNDHVGDVAVPLEQLLGTSIQHDDRGIYPAGPDGKLVGDEFHVHELPLILSDKDVQGVNPKLIIRAKYTPYAALRQSLWRVYAAQYDLDGTGELSYVELFSMLDSLGSTLTKETIESFFTRFGKTIDDELSMEEVVLCLEDEVQKPNAERRHVSENSDTGANTPAGPGAGFASGFALPEHYQPDELQQTDQSSDMKTIPPGTEIVTDTEKGKVITAPEPKGTVKPPSSPSRVDSADLGATDEGDIERVVNIKECPLCRKPRLNAKAEVDIITHLGVCASTDPSKVNRVLVTNFVTASQAQRKFLNKVFAKVTKGQYALGADSANIIVQDRQTGTLQEEKMAVYVRLGIRLMYKGMSGNMEGSRIRRMLDSLTKKQGLKYDSPASAREIEPFIRFHNLNMEEVLDPLSSFKTFNEFFYRKLKPDARPVSDPEDPRTVVSCADCRAMFFQTVDDATSIWIKGREFTVARMLGDYYKDKAPQYEGGSLAIFRLAPQDYHRYHSPVDGIMGHHDYIAGQYYTVNPMAIRSNVSVYSENVRLVASIDSPIFGEVLNVWVGAMMVASIHMTKQEGEPVKRGEETGYFAFGGSTIVVLFKPNTVQFDADLLNNSKNSIETLIRVGTRIGRAVGK